MVLGINDGAVSNVTYNVSVVNFFIYILSQFLKTHDIVLTFIDS